MVPTRENLIYGVWGIDIEAKQYSWPKGEQEDPQGPPNLPFCGQPLSLPSPFYLRWEPQVRGLREGDLFVWASMGPVVD